MKKNRQFGLIGYPLAHSFSRRYFSNKFAEEGIEASYSNFEIKEVNELLEILVNNPNLTGLNVTIPHKENVLPLLTDISDEAEEIGAVNVIKISRDSENSISLKGFNSDVFGFVNSIKPLLDAAIHKKALVLGTGGASKAIIYGLKQLGIESQLVSRTKGDNTITYQDLDQQIMATHKVIVNCTPLGTFPKVESAVDIPYQLLTADHLLYDLVYNPELTEFLKRGKAQGAQTKNGAEMLEKQAIKAWEIWNEQE